MIKNSQRTIYGLELQMSQILGTPYVLLPNTTLNEKFTINEGYVIPDGVYPTIKYFTIGNGGRDYLTNVNLYSYSKHQPIDAGLFAEIPFVIRTVSNDLLPTEQANYRFKRLEIINGIEYYCYYLKVIDPNLTRSGLYQVDVINGTAKLSRFSTNTPTLLNPTPRDPNVGILNITQTSYVSKVAKVKFELTTTELADIRDAMVIKYGVATPIAEIGVCSGIDTVNNGVTEASAVQIMYHFEVDLDTTILTADGTNLIRSLEIAGMEPIVLT